MSLIRKYTFYKRSLQLVFFINAFLICLGAVAGIKYFQSNDFSALEAMWIGVGTLFFGLLLPGFLIYRAEKKIHELRTRLQQSAAKLIGYWAENYKNFDGEIYQNPTFWLNMVLLAVEEFGDGVDHPLMNVFLELSPYIRKEIHKQTRTTRHSKAS